VTPLESTTRKRNQATVYVLAGVRAEVEQFAADYPWVKTVGILPGWSGEIREGAEPLFVCVGGWRSIPNVGELVAELQGRGEEWVPGQHAMSCNVMRFAGATVSGYVRSTSRMFCTCGFRP